MDFELLQRGQGLWGGEHVMERLGSTPGHDRSIPLPLIILGAVVLAGALAGAAPSLITRSRGRFPRLRANPDSVRPPA